MSSSLFRVVRGRPNEDELAALTALMSATESDETRPAPQPGLRGRWNDPARAFQCPPHPGPGAWRASGLPR